MKTLLYLFSVVVLLSTSAFALEQGFEFSGQNGKKFYVSNVKLNWYSAFAWCDAQGLHLTSMEDFCDKDANNKWDGETGTGKCPNFKRSNMSLTNVWGWVALPSGPTNAYSVSLATGEVGDEGQNQRVNKDRYGRAICAQ